MYGGMQLPPCGLYRTTGPIGSIPAERLVFFHNHGDPGAGIYLPSGWKGNRVEIGTKGTLLGGPEDVRHLVPLPPEGFYRVSEAFHCCEKKCRLFEAEMLVQLGYDANGTAILFVPEIVDGMIAIPERGSRIDEAAFDKMKLLRVSVQQRPGSNMH